MLILSCFWFCGKMIIIDFERPTLLDHRPYSLYLVLCYFFLFKEVKSGLKERIFEAVEPKIIKVTAAISFYPHLVINCLLWKFSCES